MFIKDFFKDLKNTIGFILFKKIFFGYILLVLCFTSYQIYTQYSFAKNIVLKDLINTEKSFYKVLATSIWHFDEVKIKSDVDAIISAKTITGISVLTPLNEVLSLKGTVLKKQKEYTNFIFEGKKEIVFLDDLLFHEFDLINYENSPDEVLAKVTFYTKKNVIFELAKESIYLILINALSTSFVLWILFLYFANKILTIPLRQLSEASKELRIKEYKEIEISLSTEKKHELNTLVENFNLMSKRINESYLDLKELTIVQEKQKNELIEVNKHKDVFLANMSHELKTPLNSINVISSVMMKNKRDTLDEKQVKNLEIINACGNDLLYLINDVLDISKLEAKEVILNYEDLNVYETMRELKDMFLPQIEDKGLTFIFEVDESIDYIYSDKQRIKQMVKNLLSNSLKFVKEGSISLLVKDEKDNIKIFVKDEGIGIEENKLKHIFDRFKQVDGSTTRKYGGTGLGLAICKEIALLLEGDIHVNSKMNVGSVFVITIPKKLDELTALPRIKKLQENKSKKILKTKYEDILVLNNAPIEFLSLIIELKKESNVIQVNDLKELKELWNNKNISLVVIDISSLNKEECEIISKDLKNKLFIIYEDEIFDNIKNKTSDFMKKPINKTDFIDKVIALKH
ncbi:MAG: HAMP domain-containing histidine kinase [Campylobacteraceae bacterium]|nr:HAMP domain-containing histidine kinase [Campylobacteraceae bacterium]